MYQKLWLQYSYKVWFYKFRKNEQLRKLKLVLQAKLATVVQQERKQSVCGEADN